MAKQPSVVEFLPVALMIGVAAALVVWGSSTLSANYSWMGAVWVVFISWALYFMAGAKISRAHKYALGLIGGVFFGWLTLFLVSYLTALVGSTWGLPAAVFLVATAIVLLELTNWFELAPAYFFSFAAYFAFVFGGFGGHADNVTQAFYVVVLLLAGLVVGYITATLRAMIMDAERVPFEARNTIFDTE